MLQRIPENDPDVHSQLPYTLKVAPRTFFRKLLWTPPSQVHARDRALIIMTSRLWLTFVGWPMVWLPPSCRTAPLASQCAAPGSRVAPPP
jgi:hypothetical protein